MSSCKPRKNFTFGTVTTHDRMSAKAFGGGTQFLLSPLKGSPRKPQLLMDQDTGNSR